MDPTAFAKALDDLRSRRDAMAGAPPRAAFAADPGRFASLSLRLDDLLYDFSKQALDAATLAPLRALARAAGVEALRDGMFAGDKINSTERRAVLHVALREEAGASIVVDGQDVMPDVLATRARMLDFARDVRGGRVRGALGQPMTDVVNVGIGGSDLGPAMAARALSPYGQPGLRAHFVSNVDGADIADSLRGLDPSRTLFVVSSKTFTTQETMTNAATARAWIVSALGEGAVGDHFAAVSTQLDRVAAFGIDAGRVFGFKDWVGGRYSVWSSIGLSLAILVGPENFEDFLRGGREIDRHFKSAPLEENIPATMGLVGFWNRDVLGYPSQAVIPYDQRLARFPAYLQQLIMESNGKSVTTSGAPVAMPTGQTVWGEPGTNGQHAFFQLLHQGTDPIPVDFLVAAKPTQADGHHHDLLVANCLAQGEALMRGRTRGEAQAQMRAAGAEEA
ncbi:MAG: glucose-6-phosphate isomerase, partial [Hyphomicrobiales bacterium]|nr:glucose-6-phosphate isomerase [Hyphomicrobiales bacterium]